MPFSNVFTYEMLFSNLNHTSTTKMHLGLVKDTDYSCIHDLMLSVSEVPVTRTPALFNMAKKSIKKYISS